MFNRCHHYKFSNTRLILLLALVSLAACDLGLGGPRSAAVNYVQTLVEHPEQLSDTKKITALLPNQVILEYARALYAQGIKQKYSSAIFIDEEDNKIEIAVSIIPKRSEAAGEREHTLIVELQRDKEQGWLVVRIKAAP